MLHPVDIIVLLECLFSSILRLENISSSATESLISSILRLGNISSSATKSSSLGVCSSGRLHSSERHLSLQLLVIEGFDCSLPSASSSSLSASVRVDACCRVENSSLHSSVFEGFVCSCSSASLHSASNATTRQPSQEALHFPSSRMLILLSFQPLVDSINVLALQL